MRARGFSSLASRVSHTGDSAPFAAAAAMTKPSAAGLQLRYTGMFRQNRKDPANARNTARLNDGSISGVHFGVAGTAMFRFCLEVSILSFLDGAC